MKKIVTGLVLFLSFGTMAQTKIGFVDSQRLLDTMPSRKVAIEKIVAHEKELMDEIRKMDADLQKLATDYQAKAGDMTPVIRQSTEKKLAEKQQQLETRYQSVQDELQDYGEELNTPILNRVKQAVTIVAERQKLGMVVDKTNTLYSAADMDITNLVIVEILKLEKEATK
jgi:outer membrane protein